MGRLNHRVLSTVALLIAFTVLHGGAQQRSDSPPAQPQGDQARGQQDAQPAPQTPVFRAGINYVRVDVIVSDKSGAPVGDLKQEDFTVLEDGKPQTIDAFKLIKLDGGAVPTAEGPPRPIRNDDDEEAEAARDDVRLFAIFLDDYHVRLGASQTVHAPLTRFIETQIGPSDMVGVMYPLQPTADVRMTRNHDAVVRTIQGFRGRKFDYTPKNEMEERYVHYPTEIVEQVRNQVSLSALKSLIVHMGSLKQGRKALILVSEGYSNMVPPQLRNSVAGIPGSGNPNSNNPDAGANDINEYRARFFASQDLDFYMRDVYETANRNNVAIYAVDPRGLAVFEYDIDQNVGARTDRDYLNSTMDTLRELALETDGRAIVNRNDLDVGMKQVIKDSSAYYLLGYNSTQAPTDGKFHEITVRVKRQGIQVRARKGYWALTAQDATRATAPKGPAVPPAVQAALATAVGRPSKASVVRTWIGTSRGANGKTKVTFVWEPIAKTPGDRQLANAESPARVSLMAGGADGSPYFRGRVPDVALASTASPPATVGGPANSSRGSRVTFEVPPGKMQLRVSVEGSSAQVLDTEVQEITVPDLTPAKVLLGTPEVYRARTAREFQQLKVDPDAVPSASREFSRTERLLLRVPVYGPGNPGASLKARLLNQAGQPMNDLSVTPPPDPAGQPQVEVALAPLVPGAYLIELIAPGDGEEAKQLVAFRVTS